MVHCLVLCSIYDYAVGMFSVVFVFFQAEDGIRDLVRSRGLGDVYKRQVWHRWGDVLAIVDDLERTAVGPRGVRLPAIEIAGRRAQAVSYTHLTLPTSDLV